MDNNYISKFEYSLHKLITDFLLSKGAIDKILPETPDIEEKWGKICMSYLPDGVREFSNYPTVSLGWMAFIGMAIANMWDENWEIYSNNDNIYSSILLNRGYDHMDEYICQDILMMDKQTEDSTSRLTGDLAESVYNALMHEHFEPATPEAFNAYVRCLHQLYIFGAAIELKRLGYHMTPLQ